MVHVTVVHARPERQEVVAIALADGATLADAVAASGLLAVFPDLDADALEVGVFGRLRPAATRLEDGDRVEIYRPLVADPKVVRRKRAGVDPRAMRDRVPRRARLKRSG